MKQFLLKKYGIFLSLFVGWILLSTMFSMPLNAQFYNGYQMDFGRSRVQYKDFFWTFYKFDRFDTYYYLNGKELAVHTAKYATKKLDQIERQLDTYLEGKIQFIIFNNLTELKESNIGLSSSQEYNIGGITHILGNKIVLYFDGSLVNFELQIRQGIVHVLLQNAIFGTNIGSQMVNSALQSFPEWYTKGLISYLSEDWNTTIDNRLRNVILSGKYPNFNRLIMNEDFVVDGGHSLWKFIADKYGKSKIVEIINMTKVSRSTETGFLYVLGISTKILFEEWYNYYLVLYQNEATTLRQLPGDEFRMKGKQVLRSFKNQRKYSELQISPDGSNAAFVTNETGKYKIWLRNMQTSKLKRLFTGGYKLDEKIDYSYPLLSWHPTGLILAMIIEKQGLIWLYFYDVEARKWSSQNIFGFEKIVDFSYSNDGKTLVFSAVQKGQSDLFLFRISSGSFEQLTNDVYDDLNPSFIENSKKIIFSSNRDSDTLKFGENQAPDSLAPTLDVFIYNLSSTIKLLRRVTETPLNNETQPMEYSKNYISFLSDANGIFNEYLGKLDSAVSFVDTAVHYNYFTQSFAVTNYSRNISEHNISPKGGKKTWIINQDLYDYLYFDDLILAKNLEKNSLENTPYMNQLLFMNNQKQSIFQQRFEPDTVSFEISTPKKSQRKSFRNVMKNDTYFIVPDSSDQIKNGNLNTQNYQLSKQGSIAINTKDNQNSTVTASKTSKGQNKKDEFEIPKQRNYNVEFSINQLVTQIDFSYLNQSYQPYALGVSGSTGGLNGIPSYSSPGFSPTLKVGVTDLMEDYRIIGGFRFALDFIDKEYFVSYANLKNRLDKEFIFQRRSFQTNIIYDYYERQYTNEAFFIATWPFTRVLRFRGTALFRNENYVLAGPDEYTISYPNLTLNWGGLKAQLIYDDSKSLGLNLLEGSRFMVFGEYNQQLGNIDKNLIVLGFDFRNYKRLHRQFIWANRFAASTNFGTEKLLYYMGGTDQWMIPKFEQETPFDNNQNWVYQTLATNMRGFNQNARNGNNFAVINSEFRMPVFRYLLNRPLSSEFLNGFQLVAFGDVGLAWTGWNPYDENNVLYTRYVPSGPINVVVHYQKEPIIGGFGFGARARLLGYFLKGDLAWGVEDGKIKKTPKFYLSMSLDF